MSPIFSPWENLTWGDLTSSQGRYDDRLHWCYPAVNLTGHCTHLCATAKAKIRRTAATMRKKGKSYFPYITIILLLKLIRDKSYGTYITVILLLKAQVIDISDAVHIYVISSYTRSMPTVFQLQYFLKKKCYYPCKSSIVFSSYP